MTDSNLPDHGAALLIDRKDVLEKIIELGRESRNIDVVEVPAPEGVAGLPEKMSILVQHGQDGQHTIISPKDLLESYRTAPERRTGIAQVSTLQSFCDLVKRHSDEHSVIFAKTDWPEPKLLAVLDYHQTDGVARFGQHRVSYTFPLTEEFKVWMKCNGTLIEQREFALFLEEHAAELCAPLDAESSEYERLFKERFAAPNELINLSRSLEIYVGQKVKRQERLQTGERSLVFETQHTTASGDPVDIPGIFMVSVRAFIDGDAIRIPARLRYRLNGGEIKWGYQLYRPEHWLRTQVQADLAFAAKETNLPAYEGMPEQ